MRSLAFIVLVLASLAMVVAAPTDRQPMYAELDTYIAERIAEFDRIPADRRAELDALAGHVTRRLATGQPAQLTFICTHNSRRSHMSQIWAATAAAHHGLDKVWTYSGGTEWTAFNPRAVAALRRSGFRIDQTTRDLNPIYHVRFHDDATPMTCFSKVYDSAPNPRGDFCAVMTCANADEACPVVSGAAVRIAIRYEDPKVADNTKMERARYDERCAEIAREMLYAMSRVQR